MATLGGRGYARCVSDGINLADPEFEPSDEQLIGLSVRAFAHVREANERLLRDLRASIQKARVEALADLELRLNGGPIWMRACRA